MKLFGLICGCIILSALSVAQGPDELGQSAKDTYNAISDAHSKIRWCLPAAGDDPAGIIAGRCRVYSECLESAGLDGTVDQQPYPSLSENQIAEVKKCHQALYNGARVNPQIKGSKATQEWLLHGVYPGTKVKVLAVPSSMNDPH